jgi:hypothetical protein
MADRAPLAWLLALHNISSNPHAQIACADRQTTVSGVHLPPATHSGTCRYFRQLTSDCRRSGQNARSISV